MTPLESLTKKLHALLPELLELKFGCRMIHFWDHFDGSHETEFVILLKEDRRNTFHVYDPKTKKFDYLENLVEEEFEILGHPITLEHVLKAVGLIRINRGKLMPGHKWLYVNQTGRIWTENWRGEKTKEIFVWIHGLPLDQQSSETIEFLDNLIPEQNSK